MYLIKSVIFNFARRLRLISGIIIGTIKDILKVVLYPLSLPLKLLSNRSKRRKFKHYKPSQNRRYDDEVMKRRYDDDFIVVDDKHKHDNYQSQIDMLTRKINECELSLECQAVRINHIDKEVKDQGSWILKSGKNRLEQLSDRINNQLELINDNEVESFQRVNKLEAKVDKILSENSKLTFKPLTKAEQVSLEIAKGEAKWHDDVDSHYEEMAKKYPDEPDFQAEQKAMAKQMAKVAKRDEEEWDGFVPYVDREENNK